MRQNFDIVLTGIFLILCNLRSKTFSCWNIARTSDHSNDPLQNSRKQISSGIESGLKAALLLQFYLHKGSNVEVIPSPALCTWEVFPCEDDAVGGI